MYDQVRRQNIVDIIRASIQDTQTCKEQNTFTGDEHVSNEVRYKLFIDASEDESLMRFLFAFNILKQETTKYICTDHSADHSQKVRETHCLCYEILMIVTSFQLGQYDSYCTEVHG